MNRLTKNRDLIDPEDVSMSMFDFDFEIDDGGSSKREKARGNYHSVLLTSSA